MIILKIKSSYCIEINNRTDICKPNEDYIICDDDLKLYIIADGVTRPHSEYVGNDSYSLASEVVKIVCQRLYSLVIDKKKYFNENNIDDYLKEIITESNNSLSDFFKKNVLYPPSVSMLFVFIFDKKIYFYNNCDTIGLLLRNGAKIQFTTKYNYSIKKEKKYTKKEIYQLLYNGNLDDSYAMINGDERFKNYVYISSLVLEHKDKIILSSDGLYEFLLSTKYSTLYSLNTQQMLLLSKKFDTLPYNKYADDKSCIIIEVD